MNAYRASPEPPPLVMSIAGFLVRVDPDTCALRWEIALPAIARIFRAGDRLLACAGESVHAVDLDTGRIVGTANVGFVISAGVCDGERLIVASSGAAVCVDRSGAIAWRVTSKSETVSFGVPLAANAHSLVAGDGQGNVLWQTTPTPGWSVPGFVLGETIEQPDSPG